MSAVSETELEALDVKRWNCQTVEVKSLRRNFTALLWTKCADEPTQSSCPANLTSCSKCNKKFTDQNALRKHARVHEVNVHVCNVCNKAMSDSSKLKRHRLVHTREKKFQCRICSKQFSLSFNLKRHERVHSGQSKPYKCPLPNCERRFAMLAVLKNHVSKNHCRDQQ